MTKMRYLTYRNSNGMSSILTRISYGSRSGLKILRTSVPSRLEITFQWLFGILTYSKVTRELKLKWEQRYSGKSRDKYQLLRQIRLKVSKIWWVAQSWLLLSLCYYLLELGQGYCRHGCFSIQCNWLLTLHYLRQICHQISTISWSNTCQLFDLSLNLWIKNWKPGRKKAEY